MYFSRYFRLCSVCDSLLTRRVGWRRTHPRQSSLNNAGLTLPQPWTTVQPKRSSHGDLYKNESVQKYVCQLLEEYANTREKLQEACLSEAERKMLMKSHTELSIVASVFKRVEIVNKDLEEVLTLMKSTAGDKEDDVHLLQLLKEEEAEITSKLLSLQKDLIKALVPVDPLDPCDVVLEVVAGRTTGGDICQQFTAEMFDMYKGFANYKNWDFIVTNYVPAEYGGLHHAAVRIAGENVYRHLKLEGGTHRVQRIPEVGLSSRMQRIHTGTMTVIILPQPTEFNLHIDPKDLRVDTFRSRGAGGQSVNTTDSAVRIVHLPTGTTAECQQSRSQLKNREIALQVLKAKLYQSMTDKDTAQRSSARKQQVGTRTQSDRIRSYNFSQDRVTDHRTGYIARDIREFMKGGEELDDLITDLLEHTEEEALLSQVESKLSQPDGSRQSAD